MLLARTLLVGAVLMLVASGGFGGQIVYQEDFSTPFVEMPWVYNNSGPESVIGYDGEPWVCKINGDGYPLPGYENYPQGYWSETYNHRCVEYGQPLAETRDAYDWMSYTNVDPTKVQCYNGALPAGWTAAFDCWADIDPQDPAYYASGRGKMGFGRYIGPYGQEPDNPCLHMWSSHGNMRVVSQALESGPGVYELTWKAAVFNLNTADPAKQELWTDWCQWGYGYTNWSAVDDDPVTKAPYLQAQMNQININRFWAFSKDPFHDSNPAGGVPHPTGEEPGQWHEFTREFAFGRLPDHEPGPYDNDHPEKYEFNQPPGYFIGFNVAHAHDPHNPGYEWGTILNVDDIVLTKKDPLTPGEAKKLPVGSFVEVGDVVITNMIQPDEYAFPSRPYVDLYLEAQDRSGAIMMRIQQDQSAYADVWDLVGYTFKVNVGDVVNVVGVIKENLAGVKYIGGSNSDRGLPALIPSEQDPVDIQPVAMNNSVAVGVPVDDGISSDAMLATIFGRVNNPVYVMPGQPAWFYVDDGTGLDAGMPYYGIPGPARGIKVDVTRIYFGGWPFIPEEGAYVAVTGTLNAELNPWDGQALVKTLYVRTQDDIRELAE